MHFFLTSRAAFRNVWLNASPTNLAPPHLGLPTTDKLSTANRHMDTPYDSKLELSNVYKLK